MLYITNALSLNMLEGGFLEGNLQVIALPNAQAAARAIDDYEGGPVVSAVGHADTAALFAALLGTPVACARTTVVLSDGDELVVGQYSGPRLPEGATALPDGAAVKWFLVLYSEGGE